MEKSKKSVELSIISDLWGLPSWYLGLSVKKIQIPTYKFTSSCDTNEYLPFPNLQYTGLAQICT